MPKLFLRFHPIPRAPTETDTVPLCHDFSAMVDVLETTAVLYSLNDEAGPES